MYVLDTNAFYYAAGISEFTYDVEKLRNLVRDNDTFISSTTLFEFLAKYNKDIAIIRKGGKYLYDNHVKLAFNVLNPMPEHFVDDLVNITEDQCQQMFKEILENKIDVESRLTAILFDMCLFSGYYFVAMSDGIEPCEYCFLTLESVCRMFGVFSLDFFREMYREGYQTDDCENYIRKGFYNLLSFMLEKGIPFIEQAKSVTSDEEYQNMDAWSTPGDYSSMTEKLASKMQRTSSTAFLQRLAVTYWKNNNDPELKKHIQKLREIFDKKIKYEALQDYCYDTLVKILVHGAALRKNDLLDAFILCYIQDQHQLITYDTGVIDRMKKRKEQYAKYAESLDTISDLKNK